VTLVRHGSALKPPLDELLAFATRDPGRVLDFFDRERTMVAIRARQVVRPSRRNHIEHVLPSDQGFLVHPGNPFVSTPSNPGSHRKKPASVRSTAAATQFSLRLRATGSRREPEITAAART